MTLSFHSINKCANLEFAQQRDKMPELSWDYHTKSFHPVFKKKRNKQNHVIFAVLCTSLNRMYQEIFKIDSWLLTFLLISFFLLFDLCGFAKWNCLTFYIVFRVDDMAFIWILDIYFFIAARSCMQITQIAFVAPHSLHAAAGEYTMLLHFFLVGLVDIVNRVCVELVSNEKYI